jgi:hypothetical protein
MDNLLTVAFEAHNTEKNHHRRYQVTIGPEADRLSLPAGRFQCGTGL